MNKWIEGWQKFLDFILKRLSENSTWRGIILVLTAAGVALSPSDKEAIVALGLAIVGLINILREGGK